MREQCVLGSLSSSPAQELENEATLDVTHVIKVSGAPSLLSRESLGMTLRNSLLPWLASYPGSSTEKWGGSLEDLITCPVT